MYVRDDIKTCRDKQKVEELQKAAAYADDNKLTYKSTLSKIDPLITPRSLILQ